VGLDREHRKALLLKHLTECGSAGAPLRELAQVIPSAPDAELRELLAELCSEGSAQSSASDRERWEVARKPGELGDG
jgi:hypothetical protein